MAQEYFKNGYSISTDPGKLNLEVIHNYLANETYWAQNMPIRLVENAIRHSLNFGVYTNAGAQVGFARVITDFTTFAYLCDVFILTEYQKQGLSKWLVECILAFPELQGLRRFMLMTKDAHGLYEKYGFAPLEDATKCMAISKPGLYKNL